MPFAFFCPECSSLFLWVPSGMVLPLAITSLSWWFHLSLLLRCEWRKPSSHICHPNFVTGTTGWAGFATIVPWSILAVDLCCFNLSHVWQHGKACTLLDIFLSLHLFWFPLLFRRSMSVTKRPKRNSLNLKVHRWKYLFLMIIIYNNLTDCKYKIYWWDILHPHKNAFNAAFFFFFLFFFK